MQSFVVLFLWAKDNGYLICACFTNFFGDKPIYFLKQRLKYALSQKFSITAVSSTEYIPDSKSLFAFAMRISFLYFETVFPYAYLKVLCSVEMLTEQAFAMSTSLAEKNDMKLENFSIERDMEYIVPMIKEIMKHNPNIKLFASPWSPPGWMKTEGSMCGGYMKWEYIDCYADYIIKYLQAYKKEGIEISAITPQNEPETHQGGHMPACIWHPDFEAKFVEVLRKK